MNFPQNIPTITFSKSINMFSMPRSYPTTICTFYFLALTFINCMLKASFIGMHTSLVQTIIRVSKLETIGESYAWFDDEKIVERLMASQQQHTKSRPYMHWHEMTHKEPTLNKSQAKDHEERYEDC